MTLYWAKCAKFDREVYFFRSKVTYSETTLAVHHVAIDHVDVVGSPVYLVVLRFLLTNQQVLHGDEWQR